MAGILELRRGNTATTAAVTPVAGELFVNSDDNSLRVGDGSALGGWIVGGLPVNKQTGASYAVAAADQGKLVVLDHASAMAVSMPQAGVANNFPDGATFVAYCNGAGTATLTPATSTINGSSSLALTTGQWAIVISDGTNYYALVG